MKVLTIVGARPQFIKSSIVSKYLSEFNIEEIIVNTDQHYDYNMSDIFFKELRIPAPRFSLGIGSGSHGEQTGRMIIEVEKVIKKEGCDLALVYGDTNTTLAGALAATKLNIPVGHVEAGLRSYNRSMPEEINRVLVDHISELLFVPTGTAINNLTKEGIHRGVYLVGDVMYDLVLKIKRHIVNIESEILRKYDLKPKDYILTTIHRSDNTDNVENLKNIWEALVALSDRKIKVFFPLHPRTKKCLHDAGLNQKGINNFLVINQPLSYMEMLVLESNAKLIVTDSGGVQKESYFFKTPAVIPRRETEWVELIDNDWNVLVGPDKISIINECEKMYNSEPVKEWKALYGDGNAARSIVESIKNFCNL